MVSLTYSLFAGKKEGDLIEETTESNPLSFIYGAGLMLPAFEKNISGLKKDESFEISLSAEEAYGPINEEAIVDLSKDMFLIDGKFDTERFQEGATIPMQTADGRRMNGIIQKIEEDIIKMDFNHPLAGVDLFFAGKVIDVRDATEEEIAALYQNSCGCNSGSCGDGSCSSSDGCNTDEGGCGCGC